MENQDRHENHPIKSPTQQHPNTGGEWFMKMLQANGVQYIFGTSGRGMVDIQDAMTEIKPPVWIQGLHEFASVAAATGYALASEQPGVALIDRVVGTANALGAFYVAYENHAPVVVFASQNLPTLSSGSLPDGRPQIASHYHSMQGILTTPWTKWRYELSNPELLPSSMLKTMFMALVEPSGPTYMTLRQDHMAQKYESAPISIEKDFALSRSVADNKSIETAAQLLVDAEKPIIWATNMGRHVSAVPKLVELAETLGCGVLDGRNFLNFPMNHPLFLGLHRVRERKHLIEEADVFLNVENYYEPPITPPKKCKVIDIYPDPAMLQGGGGGDYGGTYYPSSVRLVGDSATILSQLASAVRKGISSKGMKRMVEERYQLNMAIHEKIRSTWVEEAKKHLNDDPVSPYRIAYELNKLWDDKTIWVDGTFTMRQVLRKGILLNKPGTYFSNPSAHLGPAAAMAYGVALARPDEKVVATIGDGDFVMGNPPSVLWTCSYYHIPVLYLVFNNACWGTEWPYLIGAGLGLAAKHKDYECVDLDEPRIGYKEIAKGLRVHADTIEHPDEAAEKLKWGLEHVSNGNPALVEINLAKYTEGVSSYRYSFKRP